MRNPARIRALLERLAAVWCRRPDLRLAQIVMNVGKVDPRDLYFVEDEELLVAIEEVHSTDSSPVHVSKANAHPANCTCGVCCAPEA